MQINLLYEGAASAQYKQKIEGNEDVTKGKPLNGQKEIEVERNGQAVTLTLSDEMNSLKAATDEEIAQLFAQKVEDPTDIFAYRPQDQWLVFSQYLNDTGFFDGKDRHEIDKIENLLVDITDGLDNLYIGISQGRDIKVGSKPITQQLSSAEAQLELASSSAALMAFSKKYLSGEAKEGFNHLIEQYTKRNEKRVLNYNSIEERFLQGRAKIFAERGMDTSSLNAKQKKTLSITNKIGNTQYSKEEISQMIEGYKEKFGKLQQKTEVDTLLSQLQEALAAFVTKGISKHDKEYEDANHFVKEKTVKTFERIAQYWHQLLGSTEKGGF